MFQSLFWPFPFYRIIVTIAISAVIKNDYVILYEVWYSLCLSYMCQVMEATGSSWSSLYFVAAYILVNMVVMK